MARNTTLIKTIAFMFSTIVCFAVPSGGLAQNSPAKSEENQSTLRKCILSSPQALYRSSFGFDKPSRADFPVEIPAQTYRLEAYASEKSANGITKPYLSEVTRAPEGGRVVLKLNRPVDTITPDDWQKSYVVGISIMSRNGVIDDQNTIKHVSMPTLEKDLQSIVLSAYIPQDAGSLLGKEWTIIPILCGGSKNDLIGYASTKITIVSNFKAWFATIIGTLVFWSVISYAAWQLNKSKLNILWANYNGWLKNHPNRKTAEFLYKIFKATDPVFISQDSLGSGSLARFQILIFTSAVGIVLLYIFIHSGIISDISNTVLLLLGVTVAGGTFARATGDWLGITPATRQWLLGTGVVQPQTDKPRWSDLFETQGEIDVAKVQALLFTSLISFGILTSGLTGLGTFTVPDQIVYLSFVSQGAYVFGKFLPADSRKKVDEDIQLLRNSARDLVIAANDPELKSKEPELKKKFETARDAAKRGLDQTYVDRFNRSTFDRITSQPELVG